MFLPSGGHAEPELWQWFQDVVVGVRPVRRYNGSVRVQDQAGETRATWRFVRALPAKIVGPQLNGKSGEIAVEELHLAHEGLLPGGHDMSELAKADLQVLDGKGKATETIPVQFNPTTMQLQMSNSIDGGDSRGRQTQQYNGSSSTVLSLDLEFDTADEGTNDNPVDVRTKTDQIRQFVLPGGEGSKQAPPRVKFRWGTFELAGVMSSLTEELSLFSRDGAALRSKLSVQIKEQDPKFEALERGAGANDDNKPPAAGDGGAAANGPGSSGGGPIDRAVAALSGETAADFLARNGLAPEAWRALGSSLTLGGGIELEAGLTVGFDTSLTVGAGVGVTGGLHVGLGASIDATLGLASATRTSSPSGSAARRLRAVRRRRESPRRPKQPRRPRRRRRPTPAERASAGHPPLAKPQRPSALTAHRWRVTGSVRTQPATPAASAPPPPHADARATAYGRGVPLRDRVQVPGAEADGWVVIGAPSPIVATTRPARRSAPWERLGPITPDSPAGDDGRDAGGCGCHRCDPFGRRGTDDRAHRADHLRGAVRRHPSSRTAPPTRNRRRGTSGCGSRRCSSGSPAIAGAPRRESRMTDLAVHPYASHAPVFSVDSTTEGRLGRDLLRLDIEEGSLGLRTFVAHFHAIGPDSDGSTERLSYLDGDPLELGSTIDANLGPPGGERQLFHGTVSAIEVCFAEGATPFVSVFAEDALMRLRLADRTATYTDMSDADIVTEVARPTACPPRPTSTARPTRWCSSGRSPIWPSSATARCGSTPKSGPTTTT